MDLVVSVPRQPTPGETILGSDYRTFPGGKGANQAVAAARAGGQVQMIGRIGDDTFGPILKSNLEQHGVDTAGVESSPGSSGIALITVDSQGQNMIIVSPGANSRLTVDQIPPMLPPSIRLMVLQLEIPLSTVEYVLKLATQAGIPVMLNPAPIQPLSDTILTQVTYLILNESEAAHLTGQSIHTPAEAMLAAQALTDRGVPIVVITLGAAGIVWSSLNWPPNQGMLWARSVTVVDTTAAGDGFCGALATAITEGYSLETALQFANTAAAIAVTRAGSQPSLADRTEIETWLLSV